MKSRCNGTAIVLSWPETKCKQAGAWYDGLMKWIGINKNGFYKVGHSAIVLVSERTGICRYYDFGRYHAPVGLGRVRSENTDHDLRIKTRALFNSDKKIINEQEILRELHLNKSCHGEGHILSACLRLDVSKAQKRVEEVQKRMFIPYGPLIWNGTNCSRFVASVLQSADLSFVRRLALVFQPTISASPKGNVMAMGVPTKITGLPAAKPEVFEKKESKWVTA